MNVYTSRLTRWFLRPWLLYGITCFLSCSALSFLVFLQTSVFYEFIPWYIEPILTAVVSISATTGFGLLLTRRSFADNAVGSAAASGACVWAILDGVWDFPITAGMTVFVSVPLVSFALLSFTRPWFDQRPRIRVVTGVLVLAIVPAALALANVFVVDVLG